MSEVPFFSAQRTSHPDRRGSGKRAYILTRIIKFRGMEDMLLEQLPEEQ
jgi:hypothetical protein